MSEQKAKGTENGECRVFEIRNRLGIHARPAALLVKVANRFSSDIYVDKDDETVNGKSIMGLMMLAAGPGSRIRVRAVGPDAAEALDALGQLIVNKFDED